MQPPESTVIEVDLPSDLPYDVVENQHWFMQGIRKILLMVYWYTVGSIPCWHIVNKKCWKGCREPIPPETAVKDRDGREQKNFQSNRSWVQRHLQDEETKLQNDLEFHFMNPLQKWRYKNKGKCLARYPFILCIQILATCLITAQSYRYAEHRAEIAKFVLKNQDAINAHFLDFGSEDSKMVYSMDDLYHQIQRIADTYYGIENRTVAPYGYTENGEAFNLNEPPLLRALVEQNDEFGFDAVTREVFLSVTTHTFNIPLYSGMNVQSQLQPSVNASTIGSIKAMYVHFQLTNFFIDPLTKYISCVVFDIRIVFNNAANIGTIPVEVFAEPHVRDCNTKQKNGDFHLTVFRHFVVLDVFVIITVIASLILCTISIGHNLWLTMRTFQFFKERYNKWLTCGHIMSLQNFWLVGLMICNIAVIVGTGMKIGLVYKLDVLSVSLADWTALILGVAVFFQWCMLLHFLSYFNKFNILLLTLRIAFPSVVRLVVCTGVLYIAFMFLGWLVLGPYHPKFTEPNVTLECLFSLLNGDELYMTFQEMSQTSQALWIFSKIYIYLFVALFIYVVLSVFIALITDTYEVLSGHYRSQSKGFLREFAQHGVERLKMEPVSQEVKTGDGSGNLENETQRQEVV